MRIAVYSHYFSPEIGAPSARFGDFCKHWAEAGHDVDVVTCFPNHPEGKLYPGYEQGGYMMEWLNGAAIHRHWTYVTPNRGVAKKSLGHLSFLPGAVRTTRSKLARPDIAIGTSPTFFAAMGAAYAGRHFGVPFVMEVRDLWPALFIELGVLRQRHLIRLLEKWELWLYRIAARVVTVTEAFGSNLIERGVAQDKVATITNGADTEAWKPRERPARLLRNLGLEGKFVALYIGAHGISQGLACVLDAAERLSAVQEVQFLFVGEGAQKEQLMQSARERRLKNVRFLPAVDKDLVGDYYALADVCLVPLRKIPLFRTFIPSKMFEILSMQRPIIGAVEGEAAQILTRSGGAVVVEPENGAAIADAVATLQRQPQQREKLSIAGRRFVEERYSRRKLAAQYLDVLGEAIEEAR